LDFLAEFIENGVIELNVGEVKWIDASVYVSSVV
jgi:hypothetical protein